MRRLSGRCPSRRTHRIQWMNLHNLTHSSRLIDRTIPCLIQDLPRHRTRTCQILLRILHISLIIPCRQHHAVCHQTVQWIHHYRHTTEEMQRLNCKNSPFHPQVGSIDWGVMSLCRHSRNHLSQFFRLSWYLHHLRFLQIPKQKTKMKILNCQHLRKKKQLAVHQRSRRLGRRKRSQMTMIHDPASSSNYSPNNPANLPVQYESEEELIPHVPTSSGTGSSERTMRYTDQEDGESEDSQRTRSYEDHQADLVLDEAHWSLMTVEQKICANTGSFTVPRDIEGNPVLLGRVKGTFILSPRCGFSHQKLHRSE